MPTNPQSPAASRGPISEQQLDDALLYLLATATAAKSTDLTDLRAAVLATIGSSEPATSMPAQPAAAVTTPPATRPRPKSRYRPVLLAAVIALLLAGVVLAPSLLSGRGSNESATAALSAAAANAAANGSDVIPAGKYRYVNYHSWRTVMGPYTYLVEGNVQRWIPSDSHGTWLERRSTTGQRRWITGSETDAAALGLARQGTSMADPDRTGPCQDYAENVCSGAGSWQFPTEPWIRSLPTNPNKLYEKLQNDSSAAQQPSLQGPSGMLYNATEALSSDLIPAATRATLYQAMAKIPGIQVTDRAADLDGKVGTAFAVQDSTYRDETIINTNTGDFLGFRTTVIANDEQVKVPVGTVTASLALSTTIVDHLGATHP